MTQARKSPVGVTRRGLFLNKSLNAVVDQPATAHAGTGQPIEGFVGEGLGQHMVATAALSAILKTHARRGKRAKPEQQKLLFPTRFRPT